MIIPDFDLVRPPDLLSAVAAVADGAVPYCGGTELLSAMSLGLLRPERLASLRHVDELRLLSRRKGVLQLGATMTHREVAHSEIVRSAAPLLADVAQRVGNVRVRATGTIGGNLAFGEPRSDLSTVLVALGAGVVLAGPHSTVRTVPVQDFILGPYETELSHGELIRLIEVPASGTDIGVYQKVVFSERPIVGVAVVRLATSSSWRLVVGAVSDRPRAIEVDNLSDVDAAATVRDLDIFADLSGSEHYKRHLSEVTIRRACREAERQVEDRLS